MVDSSFAGIAPQDHEAGDAPAIPLDDDVFQDGLNPGGGLLPGAAQDNVVVIGCDGLQSGGFRDGREWVAAAVVNPGST